eukprot:2741920-Amphidinium_carterae.1
MPPIVLGASSCATFKHFVIGHQVISSTFMALALPLVPLHLVPLQPHLELHLHPAALQPRLHQWATKA